MQALREGVTLVTNFLCKELCVILKNRKQNCDANLELSRRLSIIKFSRATSRVKWLNGGKNNVSRTISVLDLRVLKWLEFPSVSYIYIPGALAGIYMTRMGTLTSSNNPLFEKVKVFRRDKNPVSVSTPPVIVLRHFYHFQQCVRSNGQT
jgi:hypothetical protein